MILNTALKSLIILVTLFLMTLNSVSSASSWINMSGSQPIEQVAQTMPPCDRPMSHHMQMVDDETDAVQLSFQLCDMNDCQCEHVSAAEAPDNIDSFTTLLIGLNLSLIQTVPDATIPYIPSNDRPPRIVHA